MIIFLLSINFIMTAIVFAIKPYGNIIRLNILIRGIFSIASFTCLACLIDLQTTININFLILPLWTGIIIFILIYIIKAPNLLETNQKFNTTNRLKSIEGKGSAGSLDNSNRRNLSKFSGK